MVASFLTNDLVSIFSENVFAESVIWKGVTVPGCIYDDEDVEVGIGEGVAEIIPQPMLTARSTSFAGIADGDPIIVRGVTMTVKNWKDDGTGVIEIYLNRAD